MFTKEEAHWASFRSAVGSLQQLLLVHVNNNIGDGDETNTDDNSNMRDANQLHISSSTSNEKKTARMIKSQSALDDTYQDKTTHQYGTTSIAAQEKHDNNLVNDENDETNQSHQNLELNSLEEGKETNKSVELTGLEEVNKSVHSRNNIVVGTGDHINLRSPANAPSHTSHTTTNALSIAEQQLAETKLKLALTESERDELEFQLIQNTS